MFGGLSHHTRIPVRDLGPDGRSAAARVGGKFSSELFANSAIEFLRRHDRRKPFFACVAFTAPHEPRQPPRPPNFLPQLLDSGMMRGGRDENRGAWPRTEAMLRDQLAEYYGLITHLDEPIGRILAALRQYPVTWTTHSSFSPPTTA